MRVLSIVMLVLLAACGGETPTGPDGPVVITNVFRDTSSNITSRRAEIVSRSTRWETVWSEIRGTATRPVVDFEKNMVIVAALGETADSCKHVRVTKVERNVGAITITIAETRLPPNCTCPPNIVRPVHVVSIPRGATNASFNWTSITEGTCN
ncbi:MAG TPA: hypothetical protein VF911_15515 [Thermoanaerobaculia bacterium]|jgi:hypothetical protein